MKDENSVVIVSVYWPCPSSSSWRIGHGFQAEMAVLQEGQGEEERAQDGQHLPGFLLHGELLSGDGISRRSFFLLLRRIPRLHPHSITGGFRQLEQR